MLNGMVKLFVAVTVGFLFTTLGQGCGSPSHHDAIYGDISESSSGISADSPGFKAFESTFYAYANQQGCVKCHASIVVPSFAATDALQAYKNALGNQIGSNVPLINFDDPDDSIIAVYAGNGHCADTPCADPANTPIVKSLLETWAKAEETGSAGNLQTPVKLANYLTNTVAVPATVPALTVKNPGVMRFNLSGFGIASLSNAIFEIEIQQLNATEYRISHPIIAGNTKAVMISGIHVYIKDVNNPLIGAEDTSQGLLWNSTMATAAVFALPKTLPTTPLGATALDTRSIQVQEVSTTNAITIGIDTIVESN